MGFGNHTSNYFYAFLPFYLRTGPLGVMQCALCHIYYTFHAHCHHRHHHHHYSGGLGGGRGWGLGQTHAPQVKCCITCGLPRWSDCHLITARFVRQVVTCIWPLQHYCAGSCYHIIIIKIINPYPSLTSLLATYYYHHYRVVGQLLKKTLWAH